MRELVLPHLRPFLAASVKAGLVLAVKASVTAEYFGANNGIGFQIQSAYMALRIRSLFAWAIILILVIIAFPCILRLVGQFWLLANRFRRRTASDDTAEPSGGESSSAGGVCRRSGFGCGGSPSPGEIAARCLKMSASTSSRARSR